MKQSIVLCMILLFISAGAAFAADTADVIFVVDESGSMSGEHSWIGSMVTSLDTNLNSAGVTNNRYALVGFGSSTVQAHTVQGFTDASTLSTATGSLVINGGTEDGYDGIDYALSNFTFRPTAALNIVLITDEDRDYTSYYPYTQPTAYNNILAALTSHNALLNAVVDNPFGSDNGTALGRFASTTDLDDQTPGIQDAILADGSGGYTLSTGATTGNGYGTTETDYVALALQNGGGAWNLEILRQGGLYADSFTAAFVNFKVEEIVNQVPEDPGAPVPEASTILLLGTGLMGIGWAGRRKTK
jgi:hypothetical protein